MIKKLLIANRGEIAIRIAQAAEESGMASVAVYPRDDEHSLHVRRADHAHLLQGRGASAYLDIEQLVRAARDNGCDAIHPGYGFLSENARFARRCAEEGLVFVGPGPDVLELFGDKARARQCAQDNGVPLLEGTQGPASSEQVAAFLASLGAGAAVVIKAVAGGGGRGMRIVHSPDEIETAYESCRSEAAAAFGNGALYAERLMPRARHIEVQLVGDASGAVSHLFERDCTVQRRHQKLIEMSPSPALLPATRQRLFAAALKMAQSVRYQGLGTFEFLVDADNGERFAFIEVNPRLQVEHTVTEEVLGIDLVQAQLRIAGGSTLAELGLSQAEVPSPRGFAMQMRLNLETMDSSGNPMPGAGRLGAYEMPTGHGVRIDGYGYAGYRTNPAFDSLLAKLIVSVPTEGDAGHQALIKKAARALAQTRITGADTNLPFLRALLAHPGFARNELHTKFIEEHGAALMAAARDLQAPADAHPADSSDAAGGVETLLLEAGELGIPAPMAGNVVRLDVAAGDQVRAGASVAVIEAMKMEHTVVASESGTISRVLCSVGDGVANGTMLLCIEPGVIDLDEERAGAGADDAQADALLEAMNERRVSVLDAARPEAVARQRKRGGLTARERVAALCDPDSFCEIGDLVRHEHLGLSAPGDGLVTGTATIGGRPVAVMAQDFTVFGGSAGHLGGKKHARLARLALRHGMPLVMLFDGGGHRIEDGQNSRSYAEAGPMFQELARLCGWVPVVACFFGAGFAANTNYAGMADLVVMVRGKATMGIAGPALVKAGTGEVTTAQALGGAEAQVDRHGLADLGVDSEEAAFEAVQRFLSYLPSNARATAPRLAAGPDADSPGRAERLLRAVPANTRQSYDVRPVIDAIADPDSVFELKPTFARNLVTAFGRLNGRPVGFLANQALVAGGTIDAPACEKGARFIALCDAFGLPLLTLIDVPGFLIGSQAESTMLGRRSAKLVYELGHATVPRLSVVLRKGYGLGYYAMAGGRSFDADACFAWPTAEICAMSVEGSVDVAYRKDYESAPDPAIRRQEIIDSIRARIGPLQAAEGFGIDDLIDPRTTRRRLIEALGRAPDRRDIGMPPKFRSISPI